MARGWNKTDPNSTARRVAVAIPCHNEAQALERVIAEWRAELPEARIVVFDNNSSDGSGDLARRLGVEVVDVPRQGKGHVVQALFEHLAQHRAVIMIDGDGTYPAAAVGPLLEGVLEGGADMAVGIRRPIGAGQALSPVRALGNRLLRAAFWVLIGPGPPDLLSGYRVFSTRFLREVKLRSAGFEIETELNCAALAGGYTVVAADVPYLPRVEGTQSKLRAGRDGLRILATIVAQSARLRPWRLIALIMAALAVVALLIVLVTSGG